MNPTNRETTMFRLTLILSMLLFASVRSAGYFKKNVNDVRREAFRSVREQLNRFDEQWNNTNWPAKVDKAIVELSKVRAKISPRYEEAVSKVKSDYERLINGIDDNRTSSCKTQFDSLLVDPNEIHRSMLECTMYIHEEVKRFMDYADIWHAKDRLLYKHALDDIRACRENITSRAVAKRVKNCILSAKTKADGNPEATDAGYKRIVQTFDEQTGRELGHIETCYKNGFEYVDKLLSEIIPAIKICIDKNISTPRKADRS